MSYKSILTLLDNSAECSSWTKFAIAIAKQHGARLIGVAPRENLCNFTVGDMVPIDAVWIPEMQKKIDDDCEKAKASFVKLCGDKGFKNFVAKDIEGSDEVALRNESTYNDLIVLGQHYEPGKGTKAGVIESLLASTSRPLLIVPAVGDYIAETSKIVIAWRDTREASLAIRQSIPQLQKADSVEIVSIDDDKNDDQNIQELVKYLALNEIRVTYKHIVSRIDPGNTLLSHACDYGANLLVMGGYGHTRLKEWALGGTTRTILQTMTLPVLMAH